MYLAIDYGKKRIGLAVGESIPRGLGVVENNDDAVVEIARICSQEDVSGIVMGMPKREDGTDGIMGEEIREFAKRVEEETAIPISFEEESFTSFEAERQLKAGGVDVSNNKEKVDELSAVLILEQYINSLGQ